MIAGTLPEDVMRDVLSRVPVKSVLRFRCIHKSWNFLFKSSSFVTHHLKNFNNKDRGLLLVHYDSQESRFRLLTNDTFNVHSEFGLEVPFLSVVGSCNGLVCLYNSYLRSEIVILYNPCLKQQKIIYFDPKAASSSDKVLGFGYDSINNDYKVVCWPRKLLDSHQSTIVYTLGMNSWKNVKRPDNITIVNCGQQAFLNGAIHWLGRHKEKKIPHMVVSFDVSNEIFQLFPQPDYDVELCSVKIDVYKDLLCVVRFGKIMNNWYHDIWVMRKYGVQDSWIRLHAVNRVSAGNYLRGFGWDGELVWEKAYGEFLSVDYLGNENSKNITFDGRVRFLRVVTYTESLVPLE